MAFKKWLRQLLGDQRYRQLDNNPDLDKISSHTTEGKEMRALMNEFDVLKKQFHKSHRDMPLDLPEPLQNLTLDTRVQGGEVIITNKLMTGFFQECMKKIIELIEGHVRQIDRLNKKTKNLFLVGGFGESRYLQEELEFSLRMRKIKLRRPETSWTAVVRGAVVCGVEKDKTSNLSIATACPQHFGISVIMQYSKVENGEKDLTMHPLTNAQIVKGHMLWILNKGDLILSDKPNPVSQTITISLRESDPRNHELKIYSYPEEDDRPEKLHNSLDDLKVSHILEYSVADVPLKTLEKSKGKTGIFYTVTLVLTLTLTNDGLHSVLKWNGNELATGNEMW